MRVHDSGPRGFSLVEMMIAIGIFGLLVAASVPAVSGMIRTSRLTGASNTLVADLHSARALANAQHTTYEIQFSSSSYSLVRVSPNATISTRTLPQGVSCTASNTATFYSWGLTAPATITMSNPDRSEVLQLLATGGVTRD